MKAKIYATAWDTDSGLTLNIHPSMEHLQKGMIDVMLSYHGFAKVAQEKGLKGYDKIKHEFDKWLQENEIDSYKIKEETIDVEIPKPTVYALNKIRHGMTKALKGKTLNTGHAASIRQWDEMLKSVIHQLDGGKK